MSLFAAKSLDISTSPTLSGRPRERGVAFNVQRDNRCNWFCDIPIVMFCMLVAIYILLQFLCLTRLDTIGEKKCKKITWKDLSTSQGSMSTTLALVTTVIQVVDMSVFERQDIKKPDKVPSPLTLLLQQEEVMRTNPYYSYSRHNGEVSAATVCVLLTCWVCRVTKELWPLVNSTYSLQ